MCRDEPEKGAACRGFCVTWTRFVVSSKSIELIYGVYVMSDICCDRYEAGKEQRSGFSAPDGCPLLVTSPTFDIETLEMLTSSYRNGTQAKKKNPQKKPHML